MSDFSPQIAPKRTPIAIYEYTLICSCGLPDPPFSHSVSTGVEIERQPREAGSGLLHYPRLSSWANGEGATSW